LGFNLMRPMERILGRCQLEQDGRVALTNTESSWDLSK
jgi:hypothetical protein